jgi:hypothetical protein
MHVDSVYVLVDLQAGRFARVGKHTTQTISPPSDILCEVDHAMDRSENAQLFDMVQASQAPVIRGPAAVLFTRMVL